MYDSIYRNFSDNYQQNSYKAITDAFTEADKIDEHNGINQLFIKILAGYGFKITVSDFEIMVDNGADPRYLSDTPFCVLAGSLFDCTELLKYMLDNYDIDIEYFRDKLRIIIYEMDTNNFLLIYGDAITDDLIMSCMKRSDKKLKALISAGVDLGRIVNASKTMFMMYNRLLNNELDSSSEYLVECICDSNKSNEISYEADALSNILLCYMKEKARPLHILRLIIEAGANPRYANDILFRTSCKFCGTDVVKYFVEEAGCDISNPVLLNNAIIHGNYDVAKMLLDYGAPVNSASIVSSFGRTKYFELLQQYNVDLEEIATTWIRDNVFCEDNKVLEMWKFMINSGIDFNSIILNLQPITTTKN